MPISVSLATAIGNKIFGENANYSSIWPNPNPDSDKKYNWCFRLLLTMLLIGGAFVYLFYPAIITNTPIRTTFMLDAMDNNVNRQEIIIEYDYDDFTEFIPENTELDKSFGSSLWHSFHDNLIVENGYDKNNKLNSFVFKVRDYARKGGKGGRKGGGKDSGLDCFSKYRYSDNNDGSEIAVKSNAFYLEVDCYDIGEIKSVPPAAQTTGCASYSGKNKYRSGEFMDIAKTSNNYGTDNRCRSWSWNGEFIGVSVRCCKATDPGVDFSVAPLINAVLTSSDYCLDANCQSKDGQYGVEIGCTANFGTGHDGLWTKQSMGVRYDKQNGCMTSRHDTGSWVTYIQTQPLCANVNKGTIDCHNVVGNGPANPPNLKKTYQSVAKCSDGYVLVDCNSYIEKGIDMCHPNWENYGVSYGGYVDHLAMGDTAQCVAEGSWMYIRAQARCCRIQ